VGYPQDQFVGSIERNVQSYAVADSAAVSAIRSPTAVTGRQRQLAPAWTHGPSPPPTNPPRRHRRRYDDLERDETRKRRQNGTCIPCQRKKLRVGLHSARKPTLARSTLTCRSVFATLTTSKVYARLALRRVYLFTSVLHRWVI
jgi:hypothetical protein